MYKILLLSSLLFSFFILSQSTTESIEEFIRKMAEEVKKLKEEVHEQANETTNTEIIQLTKGEGFDKFEQAAQVQQLKGILDAKFSLFLSSFLKRLDLPEEHLKRLAEELQNLTKDESNQWLTYTFLYDKKTSNSTNYVHLVLQHRLADSKVDMVFTQVDTKFQSASDLLVIEKTTKTSKTQEIVKKPPELQNVDVAIIMKFFTVVATESLSRYFHVTLGPLLRLIEG